MKLKLIQENKGKHSDVATAVGWTSTHELYSCGDDRKILRWSGDGENLGALTTNLFDPPRIASGQDAPPQLYITDIQFLPGRAGNDMFVVGGTDGKFYLCSKAGRVEKSVESHKGAILALRWNYEGSALVVAGEDGTAKIYSRSGMLRSSLVQTGYPIYSLSWSPNNDAVLYTNGKNLVIKPLQPSSKPTTWKAHEGCVLAVDWNFVSNLIVSGGEDRKYKVWNSFGQCLFSSPNHEHSITSVSFAPSGDYFAVGSHNLIRVCDKLGWSYAMSRPRSGSIYSISWTPDGSQFAASGGNGDVLFGSVIGRRWEWKNYEVNMVDETHLKVLDVSNGSVETLDFKDRVLKCSLGYGYLVVGTVGQCYVHSARNWNTPSIIDLNGGGRITVIRQAPDNFVIADTVNGLQVYTYEGKLVSTLKYAGLRLDFLTEKHVSLSNDTVAIRDHADEKAVYLFEVNSGRPITEQPLKHVVEINEIQLNQTLSSERTLAILDKNSDLFITPCIRSSLKKLGTMVTHFIWNDEVDMISAIMDNKFVTYMYPNVVFVDDDLAAQTVLTNEANIGYNAEFLHFTGTQSTLRKSDGSIISVRGLTPFPGMLHDMVRKKQWEEAVRLCRYAKDSQLWACLAGMAVNGKELNTAEVAYAAIDEVQKVQYLCYIKEIPSNEGRAAELALLRRQPREAEAILLGAGLVYRAIRMWTSLYNWERAVEIAIKHKTHADTVLFLRQSYLKGMGMRETSGKFLQLGQNIELDAEKITAKIEAEERTRGGLVKA